MIVVLHDLAKDELDLWIPQVSGIDLVIGGGHGTRKVGVLGDAYMVGLLGPGGYRMAETLVTFDGDRPAFATTVTTMDEKQPEDIDTRDELTQFAERSMKQQRMLRRP